MYLGCNNGINRFYPCDFTRRENSARLTVVFPDFKLFNQRVPVDGNVLTNTIDCQRQVCLRGRKVSFGLDFIALKFSKMPYLPLDEEAVPSGSRFMAQVNQYIMDNISDSNLTVEDIAEAVHVSRTLFFSRIKSLTGTTPNEFLRSMRLKVAAELLASSNNLRVTEICYMVGFTSTSYFAKCFRMQFGILPTEYVERHCRE